MKKSSKIYIAGHNGMVGSAIERKLIIKGYKNIIKINSNKLDLRNQSEVNLFFNLNKPEYVILAAAKVGGIYANNTYRAEFIYDNLMIEANIIHASYLNKVKKLLFLGSSCIYPKLSNQPIKEDSLLSGYLEYTNQPYAIAKIAGIEMCNSYRLQYGCNFISAMPTNLYGTNDNYHPKNSHVIPALIRNISLAKKNNESEVKVWGTGIPMREFLHVDDLADACFFLLNNYDELGIVNIGFGEDISISSLANLIVKIVGYKGDIIFDTSKPDGTLKKLMDTTKINNMGWLPRINLKEGLEKTVKEYEDIINSK
ncbi:GDP-L-fucose synthase [Flavobacteriaceae bacterium]|nr:GDP-L-fucose synthase [Flavobacteriaceae bacterium]